MTIGSAASLAGTVPQEPLSPFRAPHMRVVHSEFSRAAPPRAVSLQKAAGGSVGPHVLLLEDDAAAALEVQQLLCEGGYRVVGPATSSEEAERIITAGQRPIYCALLGACVPGAGTVADLLVARGVPMVWVAAGTSDAFSWDRRVEPVLRNPIGPRELHDAIERSARKVASRQGYATPPPQTVWPRVFPQL